MMSPWWVLMVKKGCDGLYLLIDRFINMCKAFTFLTQKLQKKIVKKTWEQDILLRGSHR